GQVGIGGVHAGDRGRERARGRGAFPASRAVQVRVAQLQDFDVVVAVHAAPPNTRITHAGRKYASLRRLARTFATVMPALAATRASISGSAASTTARARGRNSRTLAASSVALALRSAACWA